MQKPKTIAKNATIHDVRFALAGASIAGTVAAETVLRTEPFAAEKAWKAACAAARRELNKTLAQHRASRVHRPQVWVDNKQA